MKNEKRPKLPRQWKKGAKKKSRAKRTRRRVDPINAVIAKSSIFDGMLTIKVRDERTGELKPPRRAIMDAGYKPGDKVLIIRSTDGG